ncbi:MULTISPECIES: MarR family winged helix-turn-helix transcriptional regulator [Blautia]|uniref:MarR family winged helix-turn-helix transcriptional regulator n=1 Tax=Blautia TaxID=572511 RepID=UPI0013901564|nr:MULTISPECIES: MarR family transcriptional regulator [Blautia]
MEKSKIRKILHSMDMERRKTVRPKFQELGLTVGEGQAKILKCLLEQGSMTQRQLADKCMLDVTTMSRTLDKLQGAGYLLRTVNPSCRRSFLICITEKGKEKAASVQKIFSDLDEQIWQGISEDEMEVLYHTLQKIMKNFKDD